MTIYAITRAAFDKFKPARPTAAETLFEEVEWFADNSGIVIGVITLDHSDRDYGIVVLGRDERGNFRAFAEYRVDQLDDARDVLKSKMEKALASGKTVFSKGD